MGATDTQDKKETRGFQAEVKQLLHLMIHSLYSNKEIFLRELDLATPPTRATSCASRRSPTEPCTRGRRDCRSRVAFDKDARTITISDNGIGMSRDEAIDHLGTIAKSGTAEFFAQPDGRPAEGRGS